MTSKIARGGRDNNDSDNDHKDAKIIRELIKFFVVEM